MGKQTTTHSGGPKGGQFPGFSNERARELLREDINSSERKRAQMKREFEAEANAPKKPSFSKEVREVMAGWWRAIQP